MASTFHSVIKEISTLKLWVILCSLWFSGFWVLFSFLFSPDFPQWKGLKSWHKNLRMLGYLSILEYLSLSLYHHHHNYSRVLCWAQGFASINQHNLHNNPERWALSGSPLCRWWPLVESRVTKLAKSQTQAAGVRGQHPYSYAPWLPTRCAQLSSEFLWARDRTGHEKCALQRWREGRKGRPNGTEGTPGYFSPSL